MPYRLTGLCVEKQGADGTWLQVPGGCHDNKPQALAHLAALQINVQKAFTAEISKLDDERRIAYGYAYYAREPDGTQVIDHSTEFVPDPQNLEDVATDFVVKSRAGDTMHDGEPVAELVESVVLTKQKAEAMGLPADAVPAAAWWIGFKVNDADVWKRVKSGELAMFSIHGSALVEEVEV